MGQCAHKAGKRSETHRCKYKRRQMLGMHRGQMGEMKKWTGQVVLYLVFAFGGSHPKQGCGRVACKDLHKKNERGNCQESCSSYVQWEWEGTCTKKPSAKDTSSGLERTVAVPGGRIKKGLLECREGFRGRRQRASSTIEVQGGGWGYGGSGFENWWQGMAYETRRNKKSGGHQRRETQTLTKKNDQKKKRSDTEKKGQKKSFWSPRGLTSQPS